jgi:hypothetical protein
MKNLNKTVLGSILVLSGVVTSSAFAHHGKPQEHWNNFQKACKSYCPEANTATTMEVCVKEKKDTLKANAQGKKCWKSYMRDGKDAVKMEAASPTTAASEVKTDEAHSAHSK